jgi:hypothetical protein
MFVSTDVNSSGVYCVRLRIDGVIEEIVVDDYVPVNETGQPIFTPPYQS